MASESERQLDIDTQDDNSVTLHIYKVEGEGQLVKLEIIDASVAITLDPLTRGELRRIAKFIEEYAQIMDYTEEEVTNDPPYGHDHQGEPVPPIEPSDLEKR